MLYNFFTLSFILATSLANIIQSIKDSAFILWRFYKRVINYRKLELTNVVLLPDSTDPRNQWRKSNLSND